MGIDLGPKGWGQETLLTTFSLISSGGRVAGCPPTRDDQLRPAGTAARRFCGYAACGRRRGPRRGRPRALRTLEPPSRASSTTTGARSGSSSASEREDGPALRSEARRLPPPPPRPPRGGSTSSPSPEPGCVLLAQPQRHLPEQPLLHRAAVLVLEHSEEAGTVGILLQLLGGLDGLRPPPPPRRPLHGAPLPTAPLDRRGRPVRARLRVVTTGATCREGVRS